MEVLDSVVNWILPINNVAVIVVGFLICGILACIGIALVCNYSKWWWLATVPLAATSLFSLGWAIYGANQSRELDRTVDYEVKTVTYPDGSQVQMYTVNGEHINANRQFGSQVPEGKVVRRYIYKRVYVGIYYSPDSSNGNNSIKDGWAIVDPKEK